MTGAARWHEFAYEQTDIPSDMTIRDWRLARARTRATSRGWSQIVSVLGRGTRRTRESDFAASDATATADPDRP